MEQTSNDPIVFGIVILILVVVNFIPSFIAFAKDHPNRILILAINVIMGWTIVGWAALLFWATRGGKSIT
jgi:hypothetical protein